MPDVIHDPLTDWCACTPEGADRCGYRLLADKAIELFNPRDGDESEVGLCIEALEIARDFIERQPCRCTAGSIADGVPCGRCHALGRLAGRQVER